MSIQVVDCGTRRAREEVLSRLSGLVHSIGAAGTYIGDNPEEQLHHQQRAREEVKSFFFALVGAYPTAEEMELMYPK